MNDEFIKKKEETAIEILDEFKIKYKSILNDLLDERMKIANVYEMIFKMVKDVGADAEMVEQLNSASENLTKNSANFIRLLETLARIVNDKGIIEISNFNINKDEKDVTKSDIIDILEKRIISNGTDSKN
jgi:hypothetical protein